MSDTPCPQCGSDVTYDLACHTWPQTQSDGSVRFMSCLPCDTAYLYECTNEVCDWRYTHGLNPKNPRSIAEQTKRPQWLYWFEDDRPYPGVRYFWEDDDD